MTPAVGRRARASRVVALALAFPLALASCGKRREEPRAIVARPGLARAHGCEIRGEIVPEVPRFSVGEPGYIKFRVTTECAEPLKVLMVADSGNSLGRPNSFQVSAVDARGHAVRSIDVMNDQGGAEGLRDLGRGAPLEQRLVLAHWLEITAPGQYELTVGKQLLIGKSRADLELVPLEASIPIDVTR